MTYTTGIVFTELRQLVGGTAVQTMMAPMKNDISHEQGLEPISILKRLEGMSSLANESRRLFLV